MRKHGLKAGILMGAGAGLAYLFDPDRGRGRRARLRDMTRARFRRGVDDVERRARYAEGRLEGAAARVTGAGRYTPAGDTDLREHLRQVLAGLPFPTVDVNVDVVDGVATLRGQVETLDMVDRVKAAVAAVQGVQRVESYLHLPNTPAPNKADALNAS